MITKQRKVPNLAVRRGVEWVLPRDLAGWGIHLSLTHLRTLWKRGDFPQPVKLTPRKLMWDPELIQAWVAARMTGTEPIPPVIAPRSQPKPARKARRPAARKGQRR